VWAPPWGVATGPTFVELQDAPRHAAGISPVLVVRAARLMHLLCRSVLISLLISPCMTIQWRDTHDTLNASVFSQRYFDQLRYTISDSKLHSAFRILDNVHGAFTTPKCKKLKPHRWLQDRCAVVVTGIPLAGKKIACQRAAGFSDLCPLSPYL
jgi:hypothetical protein